MYQGIYQNITPISKTKTLIAKSFHYDDVIMGMIKSLITSLTIVYSTVYSDTDLRKHQSSASLTFVWGIHRGPVNSPHKWPVTRKMFPFDDVIMSWRLHDCISYLIYFLYRQRWLAPGTHATGSVWGLLAAGLFVHNHFASVGVRKAKLTKIILTYAKFAD